MLNNDQIKLAEMEPFRLYKISEHEGYSDTLILFRSVRAFYYANQWMEEGIVRYSELPGEETQFMVRELADIDPERTLREICEDFLDIYEIWADQKTPSPEGFSVFETFLTPAQLARAAKGPVKFSDDTWQQ